MPNRLAPETSPHPPELTDAWLAAVSAAAEASYDPRHGGFGGAPRFPPHGTLPVLLAHWARDHSQRALDMVTGTLRGMARGGLYDVLGGGFSRYAVDDAWRVPSFDKTLYDNAQLVPVYTNTWKITGDPHHARIVRETLEWLEREMTLPDGAFCASRRADGGGRFYVWTPAQLRAVLGDEPGDRAATLLEVTPRGTFAHGASVLRLEDPLERQAPEDRALLERALPLLLAAREERARPGRDDAVVTAWNALMISACAQAGAAFAEPRWIRAGERCAQVLLGALVVNGRLMRTWSNGRARVLGMADDHAALANACIDLYEATFDLRWLRQADQLADQLVALFWDERDGALFYTGHDDAEALPTRTKRWLAGAEPSANGLAALAFTRLAALTGRGDLGGLADRILQGFQRLLARSPRALGVEALAGAWRTGPSVELGIVGAADHEETARLLAEARRHYLPFAVVARVDPGAIPDELPWMAGRVAIDGRPTAYLCEGHACRAPSRTSAELAADLDALFAPAPMPKRSPARVRAPELPLDPARWVNTDGPLSLASLRGQVVVLDFWTYCCINCLHVLPELAAVEDRFHGEPVVVIGVHSAKFSAERELESVRRAVARHRVRHPVVNDAEHTVWREYAVRSWPTVIVIDASGRIAWRQPGEVGRDELARVVQEQLDQGRAEGILTAPARQPLEPTLPGHPLAWPGKLSVWPDAQAQERDPAASGGPAWLYVADTGHDRIVEAALSRGDDGWPKARLLRSWGGRGRGLVDGDPVTARFNAPQGLARAGDHLWVADTENHAIRRIDLDTGQVSTVAGTGRRGQTVNGAERSPLERDLRSPWDVAPIASNGGAAEAVFIAMAGSHQIWLYLPQTDRLGPFAGSGHEDHVDGEVQAAALAQPSGLALYGRLLLFADSEVSSIRAINLGDRHVGTVVGKGLFDFGDVDGANASALLQHPLDVTFAHRTLYVADTFNDKIKVIDLDAGRTTTLAGGHAAILSEPGGIARFGDFVLVADTNNHRLRAIRRDDGELRDLPLT